MEVKKLSVSHGVPQGSILGPFLYIVYTNELPLVSSEYITLYADDANIVFNEKDNYELELKAVNTLETLNDYFLANDLLLNVSKTQLLLFGNRTREIIKLLYNDNEIVSAENVSLLGINVDRRLDWKYHIACVVSNIARFSYAMKIISENISEDVAITAYYAYINSVIRYGLIFWGNSSDVNRIMIVQKRCIRNIFKLSYRESCRKFFIQKKMLTIISMYILDSVVFVYDNKSLFKEPELKHQYSTRNRDMLQTNKSNYTYVQKNVKHSIVKLYNTFPLSVTDLPRPRLLSTLKNYLLDKAFYTLDEFYADKGKLLI